MSSNYITFQFFLCIWNQRSNSEEVVLIKNIHLCYLIRKYHKSPCHSKNFSETHS